MKGNNNVITNLNASLKMEITAINQFFLHSRIAKNSGLNTLSTSIYLKSIAAMKTADALIDRILFLEGIPYMQYLDELRVGAEIEHILDKDLSLMLQVQQQHLSSIETCEQCIDYESRFLLNTALNLVEDNIDWLETQKWQINAIGIEKYIQTQVGEHVQ